MKKIYHVSYCDDYGEADAFYSEEGELITWWSSNDANFRREYMSELMEYCGVKVCDARKKDEKAFKKHMKELFGEE